MQPSHSTVLLLWLSIFALESVALGVSPVDRTTWLLENTLVIGLVGALMATRRHLLLSRVSYTLVFVFLCVHEVGAHYTYSLVPYHTWAERWLGLALGTGEGRNSFDRFVHLLFGLTFAYPIREVFLRVVDVRGAWGYLSPLGVVLATSMLYELIEWGAAATLALTAVIHARLDRDFQREWRDSLRVKDPRPLGEDAVHRLLEQRAKLPSEREP